MFCSLIWTRSEQNSTYSINTLQPEGIFNDYMAK